MKGIILAGGRGTRLYPSTTVVCKQLLPVYDKPMIYYPLSTLMLADCREILIISNASDIPFFKKLLGDGSQLGISLEYAVQEEPRGIAEAFIIGESFIGNDDVAFILGDNIFYGNSMQKILSGGRLENPGATIYAYRVTNPEDFGVVEFDRNQKVLSLEEKPENPKSSYAVAGLYFYKSDVVDLAKNLNPSSRGELEITDINKLYLQKGNLRVQLLGRGFAWLDTGTPDALAEAAIFIKTVEDRQGLKIGCIEEIAFRKKFITDRQLKKLALPVKNKNYRNYLMGIVEEKY
ncbi:MAG: glucose-1-phosphate thymidylyltransferase RfbA [bacterium]